jgi:hypothetical protein
MIATRSSGKINQLRHHTDRIENEEKKREDRQQVDLISLLTKTGGHTHGVIPRRQNSTVSLYIIMPFLTCGPTDVMEMKREEKVQLSYEL